MTSKGMKGVFAVGGALGTIADFRGEKLLRGVEFENCEENRGSVRGVAGKADRSRGVPLMA